MIIRVAWGQVATGTGAGVSVGGGRRRGGGGGRSGYNCAGCCGCTRETVGRWGRTLAVLKAGWSLRLLGSAIPQTAGGVMIIRI